MPRIVTIACIAWTCAVLSGCASKLKSIKWCAVTSEEQLRDQAGVLRYSLLFQEERDALTARLLECNEQEFYMGKRSMASSTNALPSRATRDDFRWDGSLTCTDVSLAFPSNTQEAFQLLTHLCSVADAAAKSATVEASTGT